MTDSVPRLHPRVVLPHPPAADRTGSAVGSAAPDEWDLLEHSISGLRTADPSLSAHTVLSPGQRIGFLIVGLGLVAALVLDLKPTLQILVGIATLIYGASLIYRIVLVSRGLGGGDLIRISDADALAMPGGELPIYTVLVPAYREPEVIGKIIGAIARLDYPADKLDVRLLLEADDGETIAAAVAGLPDGSPVSIVLVPPAEPRTKPKACNFGLQSATGEFVTIFDAEDRPEPLQLRRAVVAMRRTGNRYASCKRAWDISIRGRT